MICFFCHKPIRGHDVAERYEWRSQGGETVVYGKGEGSLKHATGQLVKLAHNKCFHAHVKQQALLAARDADPEAQDRPESDWRHQEVHEVGELEGDGDNRGTGTQRQ